jgi:conjugative transfer pilus assembly protein TraH
MKSNMLLIGLFFVAVFHQPGNANELEKVWDSMLKAGSSSQSYSTDSRNGMSLGSARIRVKTYNPNIISVRAPYIQAGCNGIDFFGGSLSILKKEELVQMGRSLVAAAPMYAFQLAFDQLCPDCNAIMADLAKRLEGLNELVKGDCKSITAMFDKINPMDTSRQKTEKKMYKAYYDNAEKFTDSIASAFTGQQKLPGEAAVEAAAQVKLSYNSTYEALKSLKGFDFAFGKDPHVTAQILMSILGTEINKVDASETSNPTDGGQSKLTSLSGQLSLLDIYQPKSSDDPNSTPPKKMIKCQKSATEDPHCINAEVVEVRAGNELYIEPFQTKVRTLMCGKADGSERAASIMVRIPEKGSLQESQRLLMASMSGTMRGFVARNSTSLSQILENCEVISNSIAIEMAISLGSELIQLAYLMNKSESATEKKFVDLRERVDKLIKDTDELYKIKKSIDDGIIKNAAIHSALKKDY